MGLDNQVGWICPRCDRVWSPHQVACVECNHKPAETPADPAPDYAEVAKPPRVRKRPVGRSMTRKDGKSASYIKDYLLTLPIGTVFTPKSLAAATGASPASAGSSMTNHVKTGIVKKIGRGEYEVISGKTGKWKLRQ